MGQLFFHGWLGQAQVFSVRHDSILLSEYKVQLLNWQPPRYVSHYWNFKNTPFHSLFVDLQTDIDSVEINVMNSSKAKNNLPYDINIPLFRTCPNI